MPISGLNLGLVLVFFVYGLAFFTMGIALTLETGRSPLLAERRALRPLAAFGLLHGTHEWMEIILLQGVWLGLPIPLEWAWLRVGLLMFSFVPLLVFGILMLSPPVRLRPANLFIPVGLILFVLLLVMLNAHSNPADLVGRADALARYWLAVPGGILAGLALQARARQVQAEERHRLAKRFSWAALGFGIYGLTQFFVSPTDLFPGRILNAELFLALVGFPVQVVRATMAILVTANLIHSIQIVEGEREHQLLAAQRARVDALEQVQRELVEREALRRQLMRHTVIAQEEERARIARELHDETAQQLTAFSLNLATLRKSMSQRPDATNLVDRLQSLSQQMSQSIYRMVRDLRPAQLDDLGLVSALQYLAEECQESVGLEISLEVSGGNQRIDPLVETVIFRVAQEALTNVSHHARTNRASVYLSLEPGQVSLLVRDQGIGFNARADLSPPHGWGLAGMRERAESLGGKFRLKSAPGQGTVVEVVIPLGETALTVLHPTAQKSWHPARDAAAGSKREPQSEEMLHENHPPHVS